MKRTASARRHILVALMVGLTSASQVHAAGCTVSSTAMAFGAYQPLTFPGKLVSVAITSDATVSVVCTGIVTGGAYTISLGPSNVGNSSNPRYLGNSNGGANMSFNIYTDAVHATIWGDGATGSVVSGSIPVGDSSQSHTVYGKVPAGQNTLKAGSYSGSATMTLTYNP